METETNSTREMTQSVPAESRISLGKKVDIKKTLITIALVLLAAAATGGGVYYVLNQNFAKEREENEKVLSEIRGQVQTLESGKEKKEEEKKEAPQGATTPAPSTDTIQLLESFCEADGADSTVGSVSYMKNTNGEFGNCGMDSEGGGGAMLISKKINNSWTKLWIGNGSVDDALCNQHKIPNKMSGGTCNY